MCKVCREIQRQYFFDPQEGDLKVWWIPQIPGKPFEYPVKTIREARILIDVLGLYDLFQLKHNIKPDYSNVGGLQIYQDGEWLDWSNDDGYVIDEVDDFGEGIDYKGDEK
jgi:hypothetical protein